MRHPTKSDCLARLRSIGLPISTIIDVGVLSSTPELIAAFPDKVHVLIEPIVEWNSIIHENYRNIDYTLINVAATNQDEPVLLQLQSISPDHPITHARITEKPAFGTGSRTVVGRRLDTLVGERTLTAPFLLKIDVDGAELLIIAGAAKTLQSCSVVIVEVGLHTFQPRFALLAEAGFELFDVVDLAYYDDRLCQFDAVFVKTSLMQAHKLGMFEKPFDVSKWRNYQPPTG
jgi:FkbM family methyltransferase